MGVFGGPESAFLTPKKYEEYPLSFLYGSSPRAVPRQGRVGTELIPV